MRLTSRYVGTKEDENKHTPNSPSENFSPLIRGESNKSPLVYPPSFRRACPPLVEEGWIRQLAETGYVTRVLLQMKPVCPEKNGTQRSMKIRHVSIPIRQLADWE